MVTSVIIINLNLLGVEVVASIVGILGAVVHDGPRQGVIRCQQGEVRPGQAVVIVKVRLGPTK